MHASTGRRILEAMACLDFVSTSGGEDEEMEELLEFRACRAEAIFAELSETPTFTLTELMRIRMRIGMRMRIQPLGTTTEDPEYASISW